MERALSIVPDVNEDKIEIFVSCRNLDNLDVLSKSDP